VPQPPNPVATTTSWQPTDRAKPRRREEEARRRETKEEKENVALELFLIAKGKDDVVVVFVSRGVDTTLLPVATALNHLH
jgi:hypothetical protein